MNYKYYNDSTQNFEDFASGKVIYHKTGMPCFPVRLAGEIFKRSLEYVDKKSDITLYDPCCGGGYMITALGFLNPDIMGAIYASDVDEEAVILAKENLSLLTKQGLMKRKMQIENMLEKYGKQSHKEALESVQKFLEVIGKRTFEPIIKCFVNDALNPDSLRHKNFTADIIIADVPYGNLVSWSENDKNPVDVLLDTLIPVLSNSSIVAIITDKAQKIKNEKYKRLERFKAGKRVVEICKICMGTLL